MIWRAFTSHPLVGTAMEARELKSLFPDARILTGAEASKAELERLDSPAILHIATHGFFLEMQPMKRLTKAPVLLLPGPTRGIHAGLNNGRLLCFVPGWPWPAQTWIIRAMRMAVLTRARGLQPESLGNKISDALGVRHGGGGSQEW